MQDSFDVPLQSTLLTGVNMYSCLCVFLPFLNENREDKRERMYLNLREKHVHTFHKTAIRQVEPLHPNPRVTQSRCYKVKHTLYIYVGQCKVLSINWSLLKHVHMHVADVMCLCNLAD